MAILASGSNQKRASHAPLERSPNGAKSEIVSPPIWSRSTGMTERRTGTTSKDRDETRPSMNCLQGHCAASSCVAGHLDQLADENILDAPDAPPTYGLWERAIGAAAHKSSLHHSQVDVAAQQSFYNSLRPVDGLEFGCCVADVRTDGIEGNRKNLTGLPVCFSRRDPL
jgi:hypothetical protein